MSTVIRLESVGKKYRIRHQNIKRYTALRDVFSETLRNFGSRLAGRGRQKQATEEDFWALRDISFEVEQGERLGIIGRNGAGKSTLLKLLSRVTAPSRGRISLKGRVGSLLEVGTGFHPELTGRENIFLNGAILGMHHHEIKKKFDEIVAFAEVEKFLDIPVKRFSSGMYVRLAFAVAAHLEPDILIVDEVLAVGDAEFQKKCLGKMEDAGKEGRTVLFVSHNMAAVQQLCQRGVLLANGTIELLDNDIEKVILKYINQTKKNPTRNEWLKNENVPLANNYFTLSRMAITDKNEAALAMPVRNDLDFYFTVEFDLKNEDRAFQIGFAVYDSDNRLLFWSFTTDTDENSWPKIAIGKNVLRTRFQKNLLNEGTYRLMLLAACYHREWILKPDEDNPCIYFEIEGGLSQSPYWYGKRRGMLAPVLSWQAIAKG